MQQHTNVKHKQISESSKSYLCRQTRLQNTSKTNAGIWLKANFEIDITDEEEW